MVYGYHAHESRMPAARARLTSCMHVWQVVPSTGTCKSINLDLARAAPYWYFTQNGPAHAGQNQVLPTLLLLLIAYLFVSSSDGVLLRAGWPRRM